MQAIEWTDVAVRLAAAVVAGGLVGFNREEHGRAAGLCTMILVCVGGGRLDDPGRLAAGNQGPKSRFVRHARLMRLPLGILSGMGFIRRRRHSAARQRGGRRDHGATLWFVTVMGLCFGGGQLVLGAAMLASAWACCGCSNGSSGTLSKIGPAFCAAHHAEGPSDVVSGVAGRSGLSNHVVRGRSI